MTENFFPGSRDIAVEINGRRAALIQGFKCVSTKESRLIESFGESEPCACAAGRIRHHVSLSRLYIDAENYDPVNFFALEGFTLQIIKPDKRVLFSDCEWAEITESADIDGSVIESVSIIACSRQEI